MEYEKMNQAEEISFWVKKYMFKYVYMLKMSSKKL